MEFFRENFIAKRPFSFELTVEVSHWEGKIPAKEAEEYRLCVNFDVMSFMQTFLKTYYIYMYLVYPGLCCQQI
jgi:hypothetical protein